MILLACFHGLAMCFGMENIELTPQDSWFLPWQASVYKLFRGEGSEHDLAVAGHVSGRLVKWHTRGNVRELLCVHVRKN